MDRYTVKTIEGLSMKAGAYTITTPTHYKLWDNLTESYMLCMGGQPWQHESKTVANRVCKQANAAYQESK